VRPENFWRISILVVKNNQHPNGERIQEESTKGKEALEED
jgi:hypothetical protein